jgi:hypothetical protein
MTDDKVRLIMKSHRCDEETARQILADIESGEREVISAEKLSKKAGPGRRTNLRKSTRPLSQLFGDSLMSLEQPARGNVNRDNGRKPVCGDRTVRGFELGED